ncbi:MAG TPA: 3'-5' exonuclease [Phaeodactylibacter sp.]|nr:3'-5' exonuclease [Phaeodactylibacter sp.]
MYFFFDIETAGMPKKWNSPHTDTFNWPRMIQIAWIAFSKDKKLLDHQTYIIRPEGFEIPIETEQRNGISTDIAKEQGVPLQEVLEKFAEAIKPARYLIAHNMNFHEKVIAAEFYRKGINHMLFDTERICVMQESTHFCKLPGSRGRYKWPTQKELYIKLFNKIPQGLHNAALDVRVTANCFFSLMKINAIDVFD